MIRTAKSYSILDHSLLHGGYFYRLSHQALSLYLFLVVVGDKEGKSFYAPETMASILRLSSKDLAFAVQNLVSESLILHHPPFFIVRTLKESSHEKRSL